MSQMRNVNEREQAIDELVETELVECHGFWLYAIEIARHGASQEMKERVFRKIIEDNSTFCLDWAIELIGRDPTSDELETLLKNMLKNKASVADIFELEKQFLKRPLTSDEIETFLHDTLLEGSSGGYVEDALKRLKRDLTREEIDLFITSFMQQNEDKESNGSFWGTGTLDVAKLPAGASPQLLKELAHFFLRKLELTLAKEVVSISGQQLEASEIEAAIVKALEEGEHVKAFELAETANRELSIEEIRQLTLKAKAQKK